MKSLISSKPAVAFIGEITQELQGLFIVLKQRIGSLHIEKFDTEERFLASQKQLKNSLFYPFALIAKSIPTDTNLLKIAPNWLEVSPKLTEDETLNLANKIEKLYQQCFILSEIAFQQSLVERIQLYLNKIGAQKSISGAIDILLTDLKSLTGVSKAAFIGIQDRSISKVCRFDTNQIQKIDGDFFDDELPTEMVNSLLQNPCEINIENIPENPQWKNNLYFRASKTRSVYATPLLNENEPWAFLYLEQNQFLHFFSIEVITLIENLKAAFKPVSDRIILENKIEKLVREQTLPLKQEIEQLRQNQYDIVNHETKATINQLIANISHEINTPIAAIQAAGQNLQGLIPRLVKKTPEMLNELDNFHRNLFNQLLDQSFRNPILLNTREERAIKRDFEQYLLSHSVSEASPMATLLVGMNITDSIELYLPLFKMKNAHSFLELAYKISQLNTNLKNISIGVEKTHKIVFSLANFVQDEKFSELSTIDITKTIDSVLESYSGYFKHGIDVTRIYNHKPLIVCNHEELAQVFNHIIFNAIQALERKGKIQIEVYTDPIDIHINIQDSGPGIEPEVLKRLFEPFFTTKSKGEGSGLGLYTIKRIIEKYKGTIKIQSQPGSTSVMITFPRKLMEIQFNKENPLTKNSSLHQN